MVIFHSYVKLPEGKSIGPICAGSFPTNVMLRRWAAFSAPGTGGCECGEPKGTVRDPAQMEGCEENISLVMTNIAIENGPFIVDLPIINGDVPKLYQFTRGYFISEISI